MTVVLLTWLALDMRVAKIAWRTGALRPSTRHFALTVDSTHTHLQTGVATGSIRAAILVELTVIVHCTQGLYTSLARFPLETFGTQTDWSVIRDTAQGIGATRTVRTTRILAPARETSFVHWTITRHSTPA